MEGRRAKGARAFEKRAKQGHLAPEGPCAEQRAAVRNVPGAEELGAWAFKKRGEAGALRAANDRYGAIPIHVIPGAAQHEMVRC